MHFHVFTIILLTIALHTCRKKLLGLDIAIVASLQNQLHADLVCRQNREDARHQAAQILWIATGAGARHHQFGDDITQKVLASGGRFAKYGEQNLPGDCGQLCCDVAEHTASCSLP